MNTLPRSNSVKRLGVRGAYSIRDSLINEAFLFPKKKVHFETYCLIFASCSKIARIKHAAAAMRLRCFLLSPTSPMTEGRRLGACGYKLFQLRTPILPGIFLSRIGFGTPYARRNFDSALLTLGTIFYRYYILVDYRATRTGNTFFTVGRSTYMRFGRHLRTHDLYFQELNGELCWPARVCVISHCPVLHWFMVTESAVRLHPVIAWVFFNRALDLVLPKLLIGQTLLMTFGIEFRHFLLKRAWELFSTYISSVLFRRSQQILETHELNARIEPPTYILNS